MSTDLHAAASAGNLDDLATLLDAGADLNARDEENGGTPLHWAVAHGQADAVRLLAERGADPEALDSSGSTPLMLAAQTGAADMISLLVERGAEIDKASYREPPALSLAAVEGQVEAARRLVELGADVNAPDEIGRTPLFWAAGGGLRPLGPNPLFYHPQKTADRLRIARLLVEHGATVEPKAIEEAYEQHFWDIARFLEQAREQQTQG